MGEEQGEGEVLRLRLRMTKEKRLAMTPLLSLRGAKGDEAISVEGGGDLCIDVVAGFIPAL
jgi:hypothetical protein